MKQIPWQRILLIFGFFLIVALGYFTPAHFEGRMLFQADVAGVSGNGSDVQASDETSYWTNSLFGGMPMYQISPSYPSTKPLQYLQDMLTLRKPLSILGTYPWLIFALLVGFYIFMRSLKVDPLPSVLGAVMWALSSYFIILIHAGHIWKLTALCFVPPTIAGLIWCYRGERLWGGALFAFFMALQLLANHVQMTYYFALLMAILVITFLVQAIRERQVVDFLKSTGVLILAGLLAIAVNGTNLYHTYQYAQETMRGGSELTIAPPHAPEQTGAEVNSKGLSKEYITQWSYGIGETWTLLVPNTKGGATEPLAKGHAKQLAKAPYEYQQMLGQMNAYWGDQPFTSGPVYVGAFVCILFIIGCVIVKGPIKWGLLIATILSILLAWGKNFMPLTDLFIDWMPMYDKFRAVSSILVIAELTIPTLAVLALVQLIKEPRLLRNKSVWIAGGVPVLLLLLFALLPDLFFSFLSQQEKGMFAELATQDPRYLMLQDQLETMRMSIFRADVWRSLLFIVLSAVPLWLFAKGYLKAQWLCCILVGLTLIDLWQVDKRYLSDDDFIASRLVQQQAAPMTEADRAILQDKSLGYRVFNQTVNSFNDATTSRWHHSVGGYHAAKLQRYQDLITYQLSTGNMQVYNMLNTKYFIVPNPETRAPMAVPNLDAFGAAWFVDSLRWVANANEEMEALSTADLRHVGVVDLRFGEELPQPLMLPDSTAQRSITVTKYTPRQVVYDVSTEEPGVAILSDIYYPHGWHATIDGKEIPIARANYVLRAVSLPAGNYQLALTFAPRSITVTESIAFTALALILLALIGSIVWRIRLWSKEKKAPTESQRN